MMGSTKKINRDVIAILEKACARNLPLDLRIVGEKSATNYLSRFLDIDDASHPPSLVIEAPRVQGRVVPVRPGQEVRISFSVSNRPRSFASSVLGRGKVSLNPDLKVASLALVIPDQMAAGGRRNFYRIPLSESKPIEISLSILAETKNGKSRVRSREKGIMTDIGGGGLGFRIPEGRSLLLGVDTRLKIQFSLPDDGEQVKLFGRICFSLRRNELREAYFGVQFLDVDAQVEYRQNVDRILRFVAEKQRQSLSERAGIRH
jgi:c-di-GMP-binding flagellar brake protein YcgR